MANDSLSGRGRGREPEGTGLATQGRIYPQENAKETTDSGSDIKERATAIHGVSFYGSRSDSTIPDRQQHSYVRQVPSPVLNIFKKKTTKIQPYMHPNL